MRSHRQQPTRLPCPWESLGKNTGVGCHFLLQCVKVKSEREVSQSCPTLSDPMDCSPPGFSVHGVFQARVLEWGAIAFSINSSRSLLIESCIFSILFPEFLIIFTIIILNSFSGSLPTSSSFTWTSVFLVYSFICVVFFCLFSIFLNLLCLRSPFPRLQGKLNSFLKKVEFFLPFGFCPPKVGPWFVSASHRVRFVLSFCLFVFPLNEVVIPFADDWICIFGLLAV